MLQNSHLGLNENRNARFPAEVKTSSDNWRKWGWKLTWKPGDNSHPIPENRPTRITALKKSALDPIPGPALEYENFGKGPLKPSWPGGWYGKISKDLDTRPTLSDA